MARYTKKIVAFIDILGFSNLLPTFERQALANSEESAEDFHESTAVNKLVETFHESVDLITDHDCRHYLFSDNICICIDYENNPDVLVSMLDLAGLLSYNFMREGYFLRGGLQIGWFVDIDEIAIGCPLVDAYRLESTVAVYPRMVISQDYANLIRQFASRGVFKTDRSYDMASIILSQKRGVTYLNPFIYIVNFEERASKISFLSQYRKELMTNLNKYAKNKHVYPKYYWLAREFDLFVKEYSSKNKNGVLGFQIIEGGDVGFTVGELRRINNMRIFK